MTSPVLRACAYSVLSLSIAGTGILADGDAPRDIALIERTGSRLVQLDVSARGPEEVLADLGPGDFQLRVGGRLIERFSVDRVCRDVVPAAPATAAGDDETVAVARAVADATPPVTYVFYLDQPLMSMAGRAEAIQAVRDLVPRLFEDARARGMLVYNGNSLEVVVDMTEDPSELLAGIERVATEFTRSNWDSYGMQEISRIDELGETLEQFDTDIALNLARRYQQEEAWRVEKALRRISMTLGRLSEYDPPKAFVYFADILRRNPGAHYLSMFPNQMLDPSEQLGQQTVMQASAGLTGASFDRLIDDASALGIRFYTVQAEGLWADTVSMRRGPTPSLGGGGTIRVRDAQDTLDSLGLETGGRSFLNGVPTRKMARHLVDDLRCMILLSFDPGELPQDEPLPVRLTVSRPKVDVQTRGRLVIQSESERRRMRLLAAFATPGAGAGGGDERTVGARVVPTDFDGDRWTALVQVAVPGSEIRTATWDLGASVVARGRVREDVAGRIRPTATGARVVLEALMEFPPGPFELVAVAHEVTTDQLFSKREDGEWPDPDKQPAAIAPIAVLQPEVGAFLRDDAVRTRGALALGEGDLARTDRPTAIIALVCRARSNRRDLRIERELSGENAVPFEPVELPEGERCIQLRDGIPPGAMGEGEIEYRVRVFEGEVEVASRSRPVLAVDPAGPNADALGARR